MRKPEQNEVVVVGRACRLPGAASVDALWDNLLAKRCSVTEVPDDRWAKQKHGHPRPKEPGKSYTWAAGVLDDIWAFDPAVFGISPREAEQMDPQQRLLLEVTWEAMEDAGLRRSTLAGRDVGVFVGASSPEYTVVRNSDMAGGDAYTATGGAISIISNRISHAFDFQGPSFTVDTACSSSLVALHQAMEALRSGTIDTAIVGGINLFMSPFGFVVFSQASMLSPDGLCQSFDSRANGYVRAEGAVVFVLQTEERARLDDTRAHARVVASGVNSDGRTNGIALPSRFSQGKLLRQVYADAGIKPEQMAFVEAHGTGTRVGDPIEANTIGEVLGQGRSTPLLVGSIKSNIGHLEPASGLAGMLKAMLALEHDLLPASINYREPNPDIPFDDLNLKVCAEATPLPRGAGPRYAGVNSFGFGGTNAHAVIADPPARPATKRKRNGTAGRDRFALAGASRDAVRDLARGHAARLAAASSDEVRDVAASVAHRREMLSERLVVEWDSPRDLARRLERVADKEDDVVGATWGSATEIDAPVAFVFSGNGGQWPGMGRGAYATNKRFREAFDEVDSQFDTQFGWSVTEALFAPDLEERLRFTHVAQPLIFAVQIATARALAAEGIVPSVVLGHSVGEIAAACVSGALSLKDAVKVIHARSHHQELARDTGRMAVVVGSLDAVADLVDEVEGVEVAAFNSPRAFTVAGPTDQIKALGARARKRRMVFRQLDLDYPFHCALIDPVREPLAADLKGLKPAAPQITFVSTVTGEPVEGRDLDADYWWRNVREPVRFSAAVERAARDGARVFMEIGPRSVLLSNVSETVEGLSLPFAALGVLEKKEDESRDPIGPAAIAAFARGATADLEKLLGPVPADPVRLPSYPWQRRDFRVTKTAEAVGSTLDTRWHRLIGNRATPDGIEWTGQLDTQGVPELGDHVVGGQPIFPAAGFIEIALSVARDWFETENAALLDLDIAQPLALEYERAKEVRARLSPNTNTLEIMSRPRLAKGGWTIHATAKITAGSEEPIHGTVPTTFGEAFDTASVYGVAEAVGLHYGPTFRLLRSVRRAGGNALFVELEPSAPIADYRLDPHRLDACFHGLFALFAELGAGRRGTAYLPVRFGHIRLAKPGAAPASALIELTRAGERSILSDFTLFDSAGEPIARMDEVRFQAARLSRAATLAERALVLNERLADGRTIGRTGAGIDAAGILARLAAAGIETGDAVEDTEQQLLLEGWATSASVAIARELFPDGAVPTEALGALPEDRAAWLSNLLHALDLSGLATATDEGWQLPDPGSVPASSLILRTLAGEAPGRSSELVLAAGLTAHLRGATPETLATVAIGAGSVDGFELGGVAVRAAGDVVASALDAAGISRLAGRAATVLQVGFGPLSHALAVPAEAGRLRLVILETDERRLERAKLSLSSVPGIAFADGIEALGGATFDAIVAAERLHRAAAGDGLARLHGRLSPGGVLVAVEPAPSQFRDLTLGFGAGWFDSGAAAAFPVGPLRDAEDWTRALSEAGFAGASARLVATGPEAALLLVADAGASIVPAVTIERSVQIHAPAAAASLAAGLDGLLALDGHRVWAAPDAAGRGGEPADTVLFVVDTDRAGLSEADLVHRNGMDLKAVAAEHCQRDKTELWVVARSSFGDHPQADPVAAALLGFARTLANEATNVAVRRFAVAADVAPDATAEALRALLAAEQAETDFAIDRDGVRVLRIETLDATANAGEPAPAAQLERGTTGGLSGLEWVGIGRRAPAENEVEIRVEASGLNFRDVMWAMSLLPDDILEDGFAGPTLGLEGAGTVTAVGPGVTRLAVGDRVLAFMPSAFTTTVCVPQNVVTHIPAGVSTEAAATIPVAFLTAYYGLVTLAGLRRGEWVLIHGAAGGVGLAAVQIAQHRGANVIATAGSREKRELLAAMGVEHVLNSRSSAFADDLKAINAAGVDVVLNSLAGEAMERGLTTLKSFGRFIELGKRDYVANTRIGLRPFRRNLSYFGVDVDQLLSDRDRASEIFAEVIALFGEGVYKPLPYRVFPAGETVDAFRLMQQSGHVGKIVVRPPTILPPLPQEDEFRFDAARTHLLTGGFGGFGLETARWLADRGVRHLVMTGRSGAATEEAKALVAELGARGVAVKAVACDVADEAALSALLADVRRTMPPLGGILHAAMVLEDSLLANMTEEQFANVLGPKVTGVGLLDRLTRGDALDYFILFSSITTFVGNPGQAAYVAANAYLEGVARRRREEGLPALALAWGAISDVGVLARQKGLAEALAKRVGVKAMPAREALDLMVQALGRDPRGVENAVVAIGSLDWSAARRLPALASPTFAALVREGGAIETSERGSIDLRGMVATAEPEAVRKEVVGVIVEEIATVLRVPKGDVGMGKRLAEIGLDSLMAIELATALQERFELSAPPSGSVGTLTVPGLAEHIIQSVQTGAPDDESRVSQALHERHGGEEMDAATTAEVLKAVQEKAAAEPRGVLQ